ncbi:DUF4153 domain-containing protein [Streptomyces liangshanensis]|uniref:DUF4173 domain-containing protein n=1 Tax=Streptomyces liangshanensis TaxID=2717324 RepID=A0A6G9H8A7_9ACTN|nr:DUF4173 domain-containing protein [Streptomyces liangshanensis]
MPGSARCPRGRARTRPGGGPVPEEPSVPAPAGEPDAVRSDAQEAQEAATGSGTTSGAATVRTAPADSVRRPAAAAPPGARPRSPAPDWQQWQPQRPEPPAWVTAVRPVTPAPVRVAALWSVLATAVLSSLLLGDGAGLNLLIVAVPAALGACVTARAAGRLPRPWTLAWALGGMALLVVPALRDGALPTFLAVVAALSLGALALQGCRTWPGLVLGPLGLLGALGPGAVWGWQGLRERVGGSRGRLLPVVRTVAIAAVLLVVFGALFASADEAFAGLLGDLTPDVDVTDGPWHFLLFGLGLTGALAAAHTAAAPMRWDRVTVRPGRPRARLEWALPLIVLDLLFAVFVAVQLAVLAGGYDDVLRKTGLTYSEYARQGFWQLLGATLLVLVVIGLARRWAPRDGAGDRTLVRCVLGALCLLTLVVVASALRRMDLYVDAYGLTQLRLSVAAVELWLGLVIVLMLVAGAVGGRWLPRAVVASGAAAVLLFGLFSPDALVAERNVQRYESSGKIDIRYLQELSADAAPALDRLPDDLRSCALRGIQRKLAEDGPEPWYATSRSERRARDLLAERPIEPERHSCATRFASDRFGEFGDPGGYGEEYGEEYGEYGGSGDLRDEP